MDIYCKDGWALVLRNALGPAGQLFTTSAVNKLAEGPTQNSNYKVSDAVWQALISPCGDGTMATDYSKKNFFATTGLDWFIGSSALLCFSISLNILLTRFVSKFKFLKQSTNGWCSHFTTLNESCEHPSEYPTTCQCQARRHTEAAPWARRCTSARAPVTTGGSVVPTVPATAW